MFKLLVLECRDYSIGNIIWIIKQGISIIQVIVPILLILFGTIQLTSMMMNPDEKKNNKKFINKFIAAIVVFFIPMIVDLAINLVTLSDIEVFNIAACWTDADSIHTEIKDSNGVDKVDTDYNDSVNKLPDKNCYEDENGELVGECPDAG